MNDKKPNVLVLMTDSQRYDTIAAAGYPYMITPCLDKLARDGVVFCNAISSNPQCMPARVDLLTGLTGKHHGYNLNSHEPIKDYAIPTLPRIFSENNYRTAGIGKMHFRPEKTHHGYDHIEFMEDIPVCLPNDDYCMWLKEKGYGGVQNVQGIRTFLYNLPQESLMPEEFHPNTYVATRALKWLEENDNNPFFLMCSWTQPHPPLMIPEYYREAYEDRELPLPLPIQGQTGEYRDVDGDGVDFNREIRKSYYGSITMIDKNIGRILDYLEKKGELDNTLVIFTSDHGEMLGDGGSWYKDWPYEGSVRIPLIVRYPDRLAPGIDSRFVDLLDILPTCLDVCGLSYRSDRYVPTGKSILSPVFRDIHVFAHGTLNGYFKRYVCARNRQFKYVFYYDGTEELYDLINDPGELDNLIATNRMDQDVYLLLKQAAIDYETEHFPDGEFRSANSKDCSDAYSLYFAAANATNPRKRPEMSKYWHVFHFYRFWDASSKKRKEQFIREFFGVLENYDIRDIYQRVGKAYQNMPVNSENDMRDAWLEYCGESDIREDILKGFVKMENDSNLKCAKVIVQ